MTDAALDAARRAYELGRMRGATIRALLLCAGAALLALSLRKDASWAALPLTFAIWFVVHQRGRALLQGGRLGLIAGTVTSLVPMSWLRPCCAAGLMRTSATTCTMPEMCVLTGAAIGLALAASMPRRLADTRERLECAAGMALGVLSLVWIECSLLFWGEAMGLVGGLLVGIAALTAWSARPARA